MTPAAKSSQVPSTAIGKDLLNPKRVLNLLVYIVDCSIRIALTQFHSVFIQFLDDTQYHIPSTMRCTPSSCTNSLMKVSNNSLIDVSYHLFREHVPSTYELGVDCRRHDFRRLISCCHLHGHSVYNHYCVRSFKSVS